MQWLDVRDGKRGRYVNWRGVNRYFMDFVMIEQICLYRGKKVNVDGWLDDEKHGLLGLMLHPNNSDYAKIIPGDKLILI